MDEYFGTLLSSDTDFFPFNKPATLPATQSIPNSPTNMVNTPYPNLRDNFDTPPLNLHHSLPAQIPVSSVNTFPRPPTPLFSYPFSGVLPAQIAVSTPSISNIAPSNFYIKTSKYLQNLFKINHLLYFTKKPLNSYCSISTVSYKFFSYSFYSTNAYFFRVKRYRTHESSFPTLDYTIHKYTTILCYQSTSYFYTNYFSGTNFSTSSSSLYFQYSNVCCTFESITNL